MRMTTAFTLTSALTLGAIAGCSGSSSKGAEEGALGGKTDSFFDPSERGTLSFEIANLGAFTDDERFLSWTFELLDDAELSLAIESSDSNLDTVMYLYRRAPGADSWGPYEAKNDDFDGRPQSRIDYVGDAGEYRVVVKPFKLSMRGSFTLHGGCVGNGCPEPDTTCEQDAPRTLPAMAGFANQSCAIAVIEALTSPVVQQSQRVVNEKDRCALTKLEALGVEHYIDYWTNVIGFPETLEGDPDEGIDFAVEHLTLANGTQLVSVDVMADEDNVTFVYDRDETLVMYFHNEQSSFAEFNCADPGTGQAFAESYDDFCVSDVIWGLPRTGPEPATVLETMALAQAEAALAETRGVARALAIFAETYNVADDEEVSYELTTYQGASGEPSYVLSIGTDGDANDSYFISDDFVVFERFSDESPSFLCDREF